MRIAIIGAGISGLACAWLLGQRHEVVVYEAADRLGGHADTLTVPWQGGTLPVDTGFMVYNERNYPNLARLFAHLGVATRPTDMSFGVSIDGGRIEYAGSSLRTLFAQRRNLLRPGFHRMWCDILRFNGDATRFLAEGRPCSATLGEFLDERGYGLGFCRHYLLPMAAAIWSATIEGMRSYPARSLLRFFANHGLLQLKDRPQWRTVVGGAATYVERLGAGLAGRVRLACPVRAVRRQAYGIEVVDGRGGRQRFDQVVLACHADQALALIEAPGAVERAVLGSFRYQRNRAVLHRDPALMPRRRSVWSSWNYLARSDAGNDGVSVTYWLNRLQGLEPACLLLESLNPVIEPAPACVIAELDYRHPQHDAGAVARAEPPRPDPGPGRPMVRRRLLGLRLPRGRPALGARGRGRARLRAALVAQGAGRRGDDADPPLGAAHHARARRGAGRVARAMAPALPAGGLYLGRVMHQRLRPRRHRFVYRVFSLLVDLDRLAELDRDLWLLSVNRPNLLSLQERDHGPGDGSPLRPWVEARLREHGLELEGGRVLLLCFPRLFGYVFNPLSLYYCHDAAGRLAAIVCEVKNRCGEQHAYVLTVGSERQSATKAFYVSPFLAMAARYRFRLPPPGERLSVVIQEEVGRATTLVATLTGTRRPLTDAQLLRAVLRLPLMTYKVTVGIHYEALRLWLKGVPLQPRAAGGHNSLTRKLGPQHDLTATE